jgi:uncharacterized protein YabN with tetrapyrrole methylase and pyrophosphatase domain
VAANWEVLKKAEKGRTSIFEGMPESLPALLLAAKLRRKVEAATIAPAETLAAEAEAVRDALGLLERTVAGGSAGVAGAPGQGEVLGADPALEAEIGDLLFAVSGLALHVGVDAESALRGRALAYREEMQYRDEMVGRG